MSTVKESIENLVWFVAVGIPIIGLGVLAMGICVALIPFDRLRQWFFMEDQPRSWRERGVFCKVIVGGMLTAVCVALTPLRWLKDHGSLEKRRSVGPCCATHDREMIYQLLYWRPVGQHVCSKCGRTYEVKRTLQAAKP